MKTELIQEGKGISLDSWGVFNPSGDSDTLGHMLKAALPDIQSAIEDSFQEHPPKAETWYNDETGELTLEVDFDAIADPNGVVVVSAHLSDIIDDCMRHEISKHPEGLPEKLRALADKLEKQA